MKKKKHKIDNNVLPNSNLVHFAMNYSATITRINALARTFPF